MVPAPLHGEGPGDSSTERAPQAERTLGRAPLAFDVGDRVRLVAKVACLAPVGSVGRIERTWPASGPLPVRFHVDELTGPDGQTYPGIVVDASVLDIAPIAFGRRSASPLLRRAVFPAPPGSEAAAAWLPSFSVIPPEAFAATELDELDEFDLAPERYAAQTRETEPEIADPPSSGERDDLTRLGREGLLALVKDRTLERDRARDELAVVGARLRLAIGVLSDVERVNQEVADRVSELLDREVAS